MNRTQRLAILSTVLVMAAAGVAGSVYLWPQRPPGPTPPPAAGGPAASPPAATGILPSSIPSPSAVSLAGFRPTAISAISESEFWVLGCTVSPDRTLLLHTLDGGRHLAPLAALPADARACVEGATIFQVRFADQLDGWLSGLGLWSTHDGGASWRRVAGVTDAVDQLEPGEGMVYLAGHDSAGNRHVMRTLPGEDVWKPLEVPAAGAGSEQIAVHGESLWVLVSGDSGALWASADRGSTFVRRDDPCANGGLPGSPWAANDSVLWAFCATGTLGHPTISTDAGRTFRTPPQGPFSNWSVVAPLSATRAFLIDGSGGLVRTVDGGASYQQALAASPAVQLSWVGFTDATIGYAVSSRPDATGAGNLWRTADGGYHWTEVRFGQG